MCLSLIQIGWKTAEKNSAQTNKQTNRQTNRHYENNAHLAVNQYENQNFKVYNSSSVAEMGEGDRGHNRHEGTAVFPSYGSWFPVNTMWPGPWSTSVPSGVSIHPAVSPQQIWAENGRGQCPFLGSWIPIYHLTQRGVGRDLPPY